MQETFEEYCHRMGKDGLLAQWDGERNAPLTPGQVAPGSHRKVWWRCENHHTWQAIVKSRAGGSGCPVCTNRTLLPGGNDLATLWPDIARQWHPARNGPLTPRDVFSGTQRKVWWVCQRGHQWQARVAARVYGRSGCPYCTGRKALAGFNDLATLFPRLAEQWHPTLNGSLTPQHGHTGQP